MDFCKGRRNDGKSSDFGVPEIPNRRPASPICQIGDDRKFYGVVTVCGDALPVQHCRSSI